MSNVRTLGKSKHRMSLRLRRLPADVDCNTSQRPKKTTPSPTKEKRKQPAVASQHPSSKKAKKTIQGRNARITDDGQQPGTSRAGGSGGDMADAHMQSDSSSESEDDGGPSAHTVNIEGQNYPFRKIAEHYNKQTKRMYGVGRFTGDYAIPMEDIDDMLDENGDLVDDNADYPLWEDLPERTIVPSDAKKMKKYKPYRSKKLVGWFGHVIWACPHCGARIATGLKHKVKEHIIGTKPGSKNPKNSCPVRRHYREEYLLKHPGVIEKNIPELPMVEYGAVDDQGYIIKILKKKDAQVAVATVPIAQPAAQAQQAAGRSSSPLLSPSPSLQGSPSPTLRSPTPSVQQLASRSSSPLVSPSPSLLGPPSPTLRSPTPSVQQLASRSSSPLASPSPSLLGPPSSSIRSPTTGDHCASPQFAAQRSVSPATQLLPQFMAVSTNQRPMSPSDVISGSPVKTPSILRLLRLSSSRRLSGETMAIPPPLPPAVIVCRQDIISDDSEIVVATEWSPYGNYTCRIFACY